jgi:hypothetical protein
MENGRILVWPANRGELLLWRRLNCDAGAFPDRVNLVDREVIKLFEDAAGPAYLYRIELSGGAETEVDAHVTV